MALAHSQGYSFYHHERAQDDNAGYLANRAQFFHVKEAFLAAGWTVIGSYAGNGAVNNDGTSDPLVAGTDSWNSETAVTKSSSGNDPWMVLQCPPIMGKIQFFFGTNFSSNDSNLYKWDMKWSPGGQFLTANGGTDGTATVFPSAPDAIFVSDSRAPFWNTGVTYSIHACWSADLSQFMLFGNQGDQPGSLFIGCCQLENAPANLQDSMVFFAEAEDSATTANRDGNRMQGSAHYTAANWYGVIDGTNRSCFMGGRGWNNVGWQDQVKPTQAKKIVVGPADIYGNEVAVRGYLGTFPDLYWCPSDTYGTLMGDSVGGAANWYCGDSFIIPWDNTEPSPRRD